jgi:exonuclease VII large subunit
MRQGLSSEQDATTNCSGLATLVSLEEATIYSITRHLKTQSSMHQKDKAFQHPSHMRQQYTRQENIHQQRKHLPHNQYQLRMRLHHKHLHHTNHLVQLRCQDPSPWRCIPFTSPLSIFRHIECACSIQRTPVDDAMAIHNTNLIPKIQFHFIFIVNNVDIFHILTSFH